MVDYSDQDDDQTNKVKFEDWFGSNSKNDSKPDIMAGDSSDSESSEDETALKKKFDKSFAVDKFSKQDKKSQLLL